MIKNNQEYSSAYLRASSSASVVILLLFVFFASFAVPSSSAEQLSPLLDEQAEQHLQTALYHMNMSMDDLGFDKDIGEPILVLDRVQKMLSNPMDLPVMGDEILDGVYEQSVWALAMKLLEVESRVIVFPATEEDASPPWGDLDPAIAGPLDEFMAQAKAAQANVEKAFAALDEHDRAYLAASLLGGVFNAEDHEDVQTAITYAGAPKDVVDYILSLSKLIDPEPDATNYLAKIEQIDLSALLEGGQSFQRALDNLYQRLRLVEAWPKELIRFETAMGNVLIGTAYDDAYAEPALLIIDPEGDDTYTDAAGSANGLQGQYLSAVIDLEGDDRYKGTLLMGPASALFGIAVTMDVLGDDYYSASYAGQGTGLFGAGWLQDMAGDDIYRAHALAQGAGYAGLGYLEDRSGDDVYNVGFYGQAFAGVMGVGLLVDREGSDRYIAGGREPDHERHDDRFISLSQGFSIGIRPFAGGGVAALIDLEGNDSYDADIYGQGVSYWYSVGFLLDESGHDNYHVHHYGQGSGIHMSMGLLADGAGNDKYEGYVLAQGNAHDYAVGMLIDKEGDDTYTADHHAQGRGMNNSVGLLIDQKGKDAYFGRDNRRSQGAGNNGGHRDYGSLAVLMDLEGEDQYSSGAEDGARLQRPNYGIIYDIKKDEE